MASSPRRHRERRQELRARLAQADLASLLVTKPANVRYLTGFAGSYGAVLLLHDRTLFFTDRRYDRHVSSLIEEAELVLAPGDLIGAVVSVVSPLGEGLGFEPADLSFRDGQRLRSGLRGRPVVPAPQLVEDMREVKDEAELACMAEAARLGDAALDETLGKLRPGVTEREVALELEVGMRRRGANGLAFPSIVAFGENAAEPHHQPGHRPLRAGDFVKLDFGARLDGYRSDTTRTAVLGRASERQRELYELVRRAQAAGLATLRAGVTGDAIDRACRDVIAAAGMGDTFGHPAGHGIGLEVHEAPRVRAGANGRIAAGTPVTVEPGVYLPGFGGVRLEDLAVVRRDGHDILTTTTKELLEL